MILYISGHGFRYELENICRLFFPFDKIEVKTELDNWPDTRAVHAVREGGSLSVRFYDADFEAEKTDCVNPDIDGFDDECERLFAVMMYGIFSDYTGMTPKWGILTGVRPGKLMRRMSDNEGEEKARRYFSEKLLVSDEKIDLALEASRTEQSIIELSRPDSFSLYVSVPFCPTRCSYCSFVSHSVEQAKKLIEPYTKLVCDEIAYTGEIARRLGLHLETVYIGGGTPSILDEMQINRLLSCINTSVDMHDGVEYTFEAGRPDTVTR
ncbi:MAG: coproporphyrinogen dehydrogenase HemZ, partial [Clostridia bacterium]|nr:coproporphyrinogen dehydrogenase HemZ [Clostridia bacterium]